MLSHGRQWFAAGCLNPAVGCTLGIAAVACGKLGLLPGVHYASSLMSGLPSAAGRRRALAKWTSRCWMPMAARVGAGCCGCILCWLSLQTARWLGLMPATGMSAVAPRITLVVIGSRYRPLASTVCAPLALPRPFRSALSLHPSARLSSHPPPCSGWDLAVKLLRAKNSLNRGRLSAAGALRHPFLLLPA